ncbi:Mut7-C RNAse domain-containing protein [Phenylobacterium sp.]|uniref:Mut7-C RNAse domain-containing protein n=1 Tax=Phenylobacterium sp. TaxID=1871053 RepID=UPI0035B423EA
MRFLCDEMLVRLARLLRAAGYDTYLASGGQNDAALLHIAREEGRLLLTKDRRLAEAAEPDSVLIAGRGVEAQAQSLSAAVALDWSCAPFTRCVMDNARLRPATLDEIDTMPPQAQALPGPFRACPACGRLYWPGSHVRRMSARLGGLASPGT